MTPSPQLLGGPQQPPAPKTRAELEAFVARRDELKDQLASLSDRRRLLADQIERLGSGEVREAPVARLREADARIGTLEREILRSDEVIAAALASGLGASDEHTPPAIRIPSIDFEHIPGLPGVAQRPWQDRMVEELGTTVPITLATVILLGAFLYWRISASMKSQFARVISTQSGRLEELQRSIDTVAVEVERVSENQRYVTKLVGDKPSVPVERG